MNGSTYLIGSEGAKLVAIARLSDRSKLPVLLCAASDSKISKNGVLTVILEKSLLISQRFLRGRMLTTAGSIGPIGSAANTFSLVANGGPSKKRGHSSAVLDFDPPRNGERTVGPERGPMTFRLTPRDLTQNPAG